MAETTHRHRLLLAPLLTVGLIAVAFWQRQFIYDQVKLYNYEPSATVSQIATDTAMTDGSRKVFYVNQPALIDKQKFSDFCTIHSEQTAVLGCYKGPQQGIYLLSVDNAELAGIVEVTAAHEMLHAEYDRLSDSERSRINRLLEDFYRTELDDEDTKKTIDSYRKSAPDDLVNEMHSILGTQIGQLSPELEAHYARYFTDRSKPVRLYEKYAEAFSSRQQQIDDFDEQLRRLKDRLTALQTDVENQAAALQSQQDRLNRLRSSNAIEAYNASVDQYNTAVGAYNADVRQLRGLVDQYNTLVERRNAISFEEQALVDAISTPNVERQ